MRNQNKIFFGALFILASLSLLSAAGISSPYWDNNPLYMNYGDTQVVNFKLQNMVGDSDITVMAKIAEGSDIASLSTDTFTAKIGTADTVIPVTISIPKDFKKTSDHVRIEIKTVENPQGGMVSLESGWATDFDVILSKPKSSVDLVPIIILLVIIIVVAGILIAFLKRKKHPHRARSKSRRRK